MGQADSKHNKMLSTTPLWSISKPSPYGFRQVSLARKLWSEHDLWRHNGVPIYKLDFAKQTTHSFSWSPRVSLVAFLDFMSKIGAPLGVTHSRLTWRPPRRYWFSMDSVEALCWFLGVKLARADYPGVVHPWWCYTIGVPQDLRSAASLWVSGFYFLYLFSHCLTLGPSFSLALVCLGWHFTQMFWFWTKPDKYFLSWF